MALINLKTNLKSLKYGNDTLGGGNSNQPYIKAPIPDSFNDLQNSNNDYILRGGPFALQDSIIDVERLGKMFIDTKSTSGIFFVAKQNLLSRIAVRTQASGILNEGVYTPLSTLAEAGVVSIGGHVLKQGLNPFDSTGVGSTNLSLYGNVVTNQQSPSLNRLVQLNNAIFIDQQASPDISPYTRGFIYNDGLNVLSYSGGPGSILGAGNTTIRYVDAFSLTIGNPRSTNVIPFNNPGFFSNDALVYTQDELSDFGASINSTRETNGYTPTFTDFRTLLRGKIISQNPSNPTSTVISTSPKYSGADAKNIEIRTNIGGKKGLGPGNRSGKNLISYTSGSGIGPVDLINALPLYQSTNVSNQPIINDLVKFRIASIHNDNPNTKTFMHFRAFIDSFSDSYNGNWNSVNYLGRGESFYTYNNFTRTISLSWTVAAQSKEELMPMYKKLNYLASNLAPDYTGNGYMTGNLVQLTIGGYLYEQVGFITSLTYDIPMESPWEIGINDDGNSDPTVKEMSHILKVTGFSFTPIHNFIPSKQTIGPTYNDNASLIDNNTYGDQRFIALANGINDNNSNYNYKSTGNTSQPNSLNK